MASIIHLAALGPNDTVIKLPHPYLTEYTVQKDADELFRLQAKEASCIQEPLITLHTSKLRFSAPVDLRSSELPASANNSPWARAQRSPLSSVFWDDSSPMPTLAQAWLLLYVLFTVRPGMEMVRLRLSGRDAGVLAQQLCDVLLGTAHPKPSKDRQDVAADFEVAKSSSSSTSLVVILRGTFWQGAGCPFGPRPVWCPAESPSSLAASAPLSSYPLTPLQHTVSVIDTGTCQQQSWHPARAAKPAPGSVVYSRWIPHLGETFSMMALDDGDDEHVRLFHEWQNDPRVSQGWNETGTLEQHRHYLRRLHDDPHQMALLARWDDEYFAYFEVYWAKEDRLGGYYDAQDFDRGRHSLVGNVRFRGPHRVTAWWSSLMHYLFLDDPRTMTVVGEPKDANATVVMYDLVHGFGLDMFVDLPHKRSALVRCSRDRFFQLCPLGEQEKVVGGMRIGLVPRL